MRTKKKASAGSWKYMNLDRQNYDWCYKVEERAVRTQMQKYFIFGDEGHRSLIRNKIEVRSAGGMLHVNLLPLWCVHHTFWSLLFFHAQVPGNSQCGSNEE